MEVLYCGVLKGETLKKLAVFHLVCVGARLREHQPIFFETGDSVRYGVLRRKTLSLRRVLVLRVSYIRNTRDTSGRRHSSDKGRAKNPYQGKKPADRKPPITEELFSFFCVFTQKRPDIFFYAFLRNIVGQSFRKNNIFFTGKPLKSIHVYSDRRQNPPFEQVA